MKFNESQNKAIRHREGPMIVIAGPGSGKTTVLTNRIKYLVDECRVNPAHILVITFSKAATTEMQERFYRLAGSRMPITFGTFHAVFFNILKAAYNYSVNNIIRDDMRREIIMRAVDKCDITPEDIDEFLENISGEISRVKTEGIDVDAYYSANCPEMEFRKIYKYYSNELKRRRLIDFDDMLLYCHELLVSRKDILASWQNKYRYILVDEFQDINKIQYEVVRLLAAPQNNLFIVGDDDQSIYGFRGSKPEIMLNFEKDYPDAHKVLLDTNYRSTSNIVESAKRVIGHNKVRFAKNINTVNPPGNQVEIREFNTMGEEYEYVTECLKAINNPGDYHEDKRYSDFAVLFRTNSVVEPLVRRLIENNIPFVLKGVIPNIFEHWITKDILAYASLACNNLNRRDFIRVMNKPLRYIGRDYLTDEVVSFDTLEKYYEDKPWMLERLDKMKADLKIMQDMPPYAMINYLRKGVGYDDYLTEYGEKHNIDKQELFNLADEIMESAEKHPDFDSWFKYMEEYSTELKESYTGKKTQENAVCLTTMHGSKGLEYDTVFIIDANEGITPHKKSALEPEIEEERRMFYVAMTRAGKELKILYAKERYNKKTEPSRFVKEIMNAE